MMSKYILLLDPFTDIFMKSIGEATICAITERKCLKKTISVRVTVH